MSGESFVVEVDVSPIQNAIHNFGLEPNGKTQRFFTNELMRLSDPYVPFDNGPLKNSAQVSPDGTEIIYSTPYARYHWFGKLAVDPITGKGSFFKEGYGHWSRPKTEKVITERDMEYHGSALRGPRWVERAFADNQNSLINSTIDYMRSLQK